MTDGDVHIVPVDDLVDHDIDEDCVCRPTPEFVNPDTGTAYRVTLWAHHSLDGRELIEV